MADCGTYTHQMIEFAGLLDLQNAQIVRAEIDSIDTATNTAAVTLIDTCELLGSLSLEAVEFFYHCEFSTGTVEDLAQGNKAFAVGDVVYMVVIPENGTVAARTYIVGHVDIKNTKVCRKEYILLELVFAGGYEVTAIYDVSTGALLDLTTFEERAGSPTTPTSAIGINDSTFNSWWIYNFKYLPSVPLPIIDATILTHRGDTCSGTPSWGSGLPPSGDADIYTPYTGDEFITTGTPGDICPSLDLGNELEHYKWTTVPSICADATNGQNGELILAEIEGFVDKSHLGNGDEWCGAYFTSSTYDFHLTITQMGADYGVPITDNTSSVTKIIYHTDTAETSDSRSITISGTGLSASATRLRKNVLKYSGSAFGLWDITYEFGGEVTASFSDTGSDPPHELRGDVLSASTQSGTFEDYRGRDYFKQSSTWDKVDMFGRLVGETFVLVLTGQQLWYTTSGAVGAENFTFTVNSTLPAFSAQNSSFDTTKNAAAGGIAGVPYAVLTRITGDDDITSTLSLHTLMARGDAVASDGFNQAVMAMYDALTTHVGTDDADWLVMFNDTLNVNFDGPRLSTLVRRD